MGEAKKILCFIESLEAGGAQRQLLFLVSLLKKKGYRPAIVTYYPNDFYAEALASMGVEHIMLEVSGSKMKRFAAFRRVIKDEAPHCVVSFSESASMVLCAIRMFRRFRLIVSERNTTTQMSNMDRLRFQLYRWADCVVCNSHSQTQFMERATPFLNAKTSTIINYLDTDQFCPRQREGKSTAQKRLIVLARIAPQKNVLRFIEALKMVRDDGYAVTVDWYGHPWEDYSAQCQALIDKYRLGDLLRIHAPQSHAERLYVEYDGCCLPSIYEGFPNVLGEAMSCGLPVLCGDVCDNRFLVGDNGNFVFNPYDISDMKDKVEEFCRLDEEALLAIGARNRERAVGIFSSDEFVNKYIKLIES